MSSGLILTARISERKKVSPQKAHSQSMDRTRSGSLLMIQGLLDIRHSCLHVRSVRE